MGMAAILVMWPGPFEQSFVPLSHGGATWNLALISLAVSREKKFANVELSDLGPRPMNDLDLWYSYRFMYLFSFTAYINFNNADYNSFWKIHCFTLFPYKSIRDQILPCRKISQDQTGVIIWTNFVVLEHPILHAKVQGHQSFCSGEEDFFKFFSIYGHGGAQDHLIKLLFPNPKEAPNKIWIQPSQWFQRRRCLKMLTYINTYIHTHIHTDIRTTEAYLYHKLTSQPSAQVCK